ncbi:hypothetical protein PV08_05487 [Exophiala spinifera]|uniref:Zn(2)-C6 fungal-type domain-containing protein n=1 Tax=Exophiala spinifera TaxID=91928 RepID=A0A0D1YKE1_9EURO|nr:uncharacterized protein PV08_05487 [Exophiala spinifera]KIW15441.1 hypothetical protein PV08_05487 [Exophiala spinifera]
MDASVPDSRRRSSRAGRHHKVSAACLQCRTKKIKCDGERPICGPCLKRHGDQATCTLRPTAEQELALFREKIAELDDKIRQLESRDVGSSTLSGPGPDAEQAVPPLSDVQSREVWEGLRRGEVSLSSGSYRAPADVDPMVGASSNNFSSDSIFFGSSSASGFVRQVEEAFYPEGESPNSAAAGVDTHGPAASRHPSAPSEDLSTQTLQLPHQSAADHLLGIYWTIVDPLYPFLDKAETQARCARLWADGPPLNVTRSFVCQINMIFAMTSQLDERVPPGDRAGHAEVYLDRAMRHLVSELWESASLQSVQNFLILAQYLQSTNKGYQCWMVVGHAVRMAQNLGLHLRETSEKIHSARKRQLYRKVWHGCILMDRIVALTFGRPTVVSLKDASCVPLPLPVDDEFLPEESTMEPHSIPKGPMVVEFYIETLKLYAILDEILTTLYATTTAVPRIASNESQSSSLRARRMTALLQLDLSLASWLKSLPDHLRPVHTQASLSPFFRQGIVLHSRYLHVRILLFRPMLARFITARNESKVVEQQAETTLYETLTHRASVSCVETAVHAVETIESRLPESDGAIGALPAWWYNVLYVYTAAVVLLAAAGCAELHLQVPRRHILACWGKAHRVLSSYLAYSPSVQRSITALEVLFSRIAAQNRLSFPMSNWKSMDHGPEFAEELPASQNLERNMDMSGLHADMFSHSTPNVDPTAFAFNSTNYSSGLSSELWMNGIPDARPDSGHQHLFARPGDMTWFSDLQFNM